MSCFMPGMFRDRCSHQCPSLTLLHQLHRPGQPLETGISASFSCIPRLEWSTWHRQILDVQVVRIGKGILRMQFQIVSGPAKAGPAAHQQRGWYVSWAPGISKGFQGDLHADPGRITECDHKALSSVVAFDG